MLLYFQRMYSYNDLTKACKTEEKAGVDSLLTPLGVEEDSIHEGRHALSLLEVVYYDLSLSFSVTDQ